VVNGYPAVLATLGRSPRFFFALTTLLRFSVGLGFLERPLAVGVLWGLATGEWALAANCAVFFELFWLDLFPAGTYIPPNAVASMLLTLGVSHYFGVQQASLLVIPVLLSLPAAMLCSKVEYWQRRMQNEGYNKLMRWARRNEDTNEPGRLILRSLAQQVAMHTAFLSLCLLVLIGTIKVMYWYLGHLPSISGIQWSHLWFIGGIGGVMSLRVPRFYAVFLICLVCVVLLRTV